MITCSRCSKENQDHYKFCLGCGAKLEKPGASITPNNPPAANPVGGGVAGRSTAAGQAMGAGAAASARPSAVVGRLSTTGSEAGGYTPPPASVVSPAPQAAVPLATATPAPRSAPVAVAPAAAAPAAAPGACPQCGANILPTNTFCGRCGFRLKTGDGPGPGDAGAGFAASPSTAGGAPIPRTMFMAGAQAAVRPGPRGHLTLIRPDGSEGGMHPIVAGDNLIGRGQGSLFDADPYLSPRHAEFGLDGDGLVVRDLKSLNGVFLKVTEEEALDSGSIFRLGQELLRFDVIEAPQPLEDGTEIIGTPNPGYWGRISVIVGRDVDGPAFPIFEDSIVLGRERGDILFPEDGYVSATHARISLRDEHVYLQDLGSSNGTFIRISSQRNIPSGSLLLMGQQLFRVQFQ